MASKYDSFWRAKADKLAEMINSALTGHSAEADVSEIRDLGKRTSWSGSAVVHGTYLTDAPMAHAASLGHVVVELGLCKSMPEVDFRFTITSSCRLRISAERAARKGDPTGSGSDTHLPRISLGSHSFETIASMDSTQACGEIHRLLLRLPLYESPGSVSFQDGLYFFYEIDEESGHAVEGRVVRIGNHPRSQGRLIKRLEEHFRSSKGAKNGSVFRRYLGGALLRRDDPNSPCLSPNPGLGHWEKQDLPTCERCTPYEQEVTHYISGRMKFRCVCILDQVERNRFENLLIATIASCSVCHHTDQWLGRLAYSEDVQRSGLWNSDYIDGPTLRVEDLRRFSELIRSTVGVQKGRNLSDTLLIIPCCQSKRGVSDTSLPVRRISEYLTPVSVGFLEEGRKLAFAKNTLHQATSLKQALALYTGQPYAAEGFRELLIDALRDGLHCLIVSGGYGLLRPEEPIHQYEAHLTKTMSIWRRRLPTILKEYIARNGISRTFGSFSSGYAAVVPARLTKENWRAIPEYDQERDHGIALKVVPKKVGAALVSLLRNDFSPSEEWMPV